MMAKKGKKKRLPRIISIIYRVDNICSSTEVDI
jgi:hypothetical protein